MIQFMYSFRGYTAPPEMLDAVRRGVAGAFCLFAYNVESLEQVRRLTGSLYQAAREGGQLPPIIGIDQEGGQLIAIRGGATELPGNMALGATRSPQLAEQAGHVLGRELRALGINMNYAPSLDVNNNPENPVIGIRAFGASPALVGELGAALIKGLQAEGVIAVAKHFPGHGDVQGDSHHTAPTVTHDRARLFALEIPPFREAFRAGVGAIMSSHVVYTAFDDHNPATISRAIMHDLLRDELGYTGLSITDAMDMYAVAHLGAIPSIGAALNAGVDLVLLGHLPHQLQLAEHFSREHITSPEIVARITSARRAIPTGNLPFEVIGSVDHVHVAQDIADKAVTLVKGGEYLPLRPQPDDEIVVITPRPVNLTPADTSADVQIGLAEAIARRYVPTRTLQSQPVNESPLVGDISAVLAEVGDAQIVVIGTIIAERDATQAALVRALHASGKRVIVISLRTPYDLAAFPMIDTYLCTYGIRPANIEAAVRALFGEITPEGVLPCPIPGETVTE